MICRPKLVTPAVAEWVSGRRSLHWVAESQDLKSFSGKFDALQGPQHLGQQYMQILAECSSVQPADGDFRPGDRHASKRVERQFTFRRAFG